MRVAYIDVETTPILAWVWKLYQPIIGIDQIVEPTRVMCHAVRWEGQKRTKFDAEWLDGGREGYLARLHKMIDEADVLVHWNGQSFDTPHIMRELKEAGFDPPSPFRQLDLMLGVKKVFRFESNKLDYISQRLLGDRKVSHTGFRLWLDVMAGDEKARRLMAKYNRQDVDLLVDQYEELKAWVPLPINRSVVDGDGAGCPACGSADLMPRGYAYTKASKYRRFWCRDCGKWTRGTKREYGGTVAEVAP